MESCWCQYKNQTVVVYISIMITFALTVAVIIFHTFHYTYLLNIVKGIVSKFKNTPRQFEHGASINNHKENSQPLITYSEVELPKRAMDHVTADEEQNMLSKCSDDGNTAGKVATDQ